MPHATFFNLPDNKRQRIMDAVWTEFTTVSYADASINHIVQNAGISRGSFYQYFSGKQELFTYVLQTILETGKQLFLAQLTAHNNDLFFAVLGMYDLLVWQKAKSRATEAQTRIHKLMELNSHMDMNQFALHLDQEKLTREIRMLMERSGFHQLTPQECCAVLHMISAAGMSNLADTLRRPQNEAHNRALLEQELLIIRRGLTVSQTETGKAE